MAEHELKTWPVFYQAIEDGTKTFEIRKMDRDFKVGDILRLREWMPDDYYAGTPDFGRPTGYTGRECNRVVTYVLAGSNYTADGFAALGIKLKEDSTLAIMAARKAYGYGVANCVFLGSCAADRRTEEAAGEAVLEAKKEIDAKEPRA